MHHPICNHAFKQSVRMIITTSLMAALLFLPACGRQNNSDSGNGDTSSSSDGIYYAVSKQEESPYDVVNDLNGASFIITEDSLTANGLTAMLFWQGEGDATFGSAFSLEVWENEAWHPLAVREHSNGIVYVFSDIAYRLDENGKEMNYDWMGYYGTLSAGSYRILTPIDVYHNGAYTFHSLAAEFTIEDET